MKYVEVIAESTSSNTINAIAEKAKALDFRQGIVGEDGMQQMRMLLDDDQLQLALDTLENALGAQPTARVVVFPIEASWPKNESKVATKNEAAAREVIYQEVEKGSRLDSNYISLVILSTVVVAIGLIENNIAVIIGAMVIAPLLGPNLALSLGTALGDQDLMRKSALTLFVGIGLAIILSTLIGLFFPNALESHEIMSRTDVQMEAVILALASGAAAALSLTTGLSGVLVGVMVAVALLPPAATIGIMLANAHFSLAMGATLLLAVNVVSVNLSSKIVFFLKKIRPRTWLEKEKAKRAMLVYMIGWIVTLLILLVLIYVRHVL